MTRFNLRNRVAKALYTSDSASDSNGERMTPQNTSIGRVGGHDWERTESSITKQSNGERRATVPQHVYSPVKGEPRSFNPFDLRQLANSEVIRAVEGTILGDIGAVPWSVVPVSDGANPPDSSLEDAERALDDLNPNPETFDDVNEMLARDLMEIGNCVNAITPNESGRQAEVVTFDAATFTADWSEHRILEGFYQYPQADNAKWGEPIPFDREEVMWGVYNPTTQRAGFYGLSPVEQVERMINVMGGLVEKELAELEEGMPSGLISLPDFTDSDWENFKAYWNNEVAGEQMKHPSANTDADFIPFSMTYKELQVLDRQQWYAKLVGGVFQVPMSETGLAIGEEMTRATDISQRQRYKQKALGSILEQLEDFWTYQYLHRWFSEDIKLSFDPGRDLMEKDTLSQIHDRQLTNGLRTVNEIREEQGKDEVEWGDQPGTPAIWAKTKYREVPSDVFGNEEPTGPQPQPDGPTPEQANQNALDEGLQQQQPAADGGVSKMRSGATWMPDESLSVMKAVDDPEPASDTELRPNVDADETYVTVTDDEVDELAQDLEALVGDYIQDVMNQVKGNQQLLRLGREADMSEASGMSVQKSIFDLRELVREAIGLNFAEDVAGVLNTHKYTQVVEGEQIILDKLDQAGVDLSTLNVDSMRDRVAESIQSGTLDVTKPVSRRLESDLKDVLTDAWRNGWSITETEQAIESVADAWTGHQTERLARNELIGASKAGRLKYAHETSDKTGGWEKTWYDSSDHRVRPSHENMDGETVPEHEPFIVNYAPDGGPPAVEESYPGDSVHGILCRCSMKLSPAGLNVQKARWHRGAVVETPKGDTGVVTDIYTSDFASYTDSDTIIEVADDETVYAVALESGTFGYFSAGELTESEIPDGEKAKTDDLSDDEVAKIMKADETFDLPDGWTRLSLLDAWSSMGGSFTGCVAEMSGEVSDVDGFCASMKDRVLGTELWR